MSQTQRDVAAETQERHTNKLPTAEDRGAFVERVTKAMEDSARALLDTAKALRANPEEMLKHAFSPNTIDMHPGAIAALEIMHLGDILLSNKPSIVIKGKTVIDESEVGFRVMWRDNAIISLKDC